MTLFLQTFEINSCKLDFNGKIITVQGSIRNRRGALSLLCSGVLGDYFQLCFAFRNQNWSRKRDSHIVLTIASVSKTETSKDVSGNIFANYFCHDYRLQKVFAHYDAIIDRDANVLRIMSISKWCLRLVLF